MRKKIGAVLALLLLAAALGGCQRQRAAAKEISDALGVDVSDGEQLAYTDSHGGFHGDGLTFAALKFPDAALADEIKGKEGWKALPLSKNLTAAAYGISDETSSTGPYLTDEDGEPVLPEIENGYYYFQDRHAKSADAYDDTELLDRASLNFTIALYDVDTDTLYYVKYDT